ncbi:nucleotide-binding protein [Streptomyces sp. MS1.HAVA.3]|uniref:Nucleotide-binding protein n=1 Tax=Streptomyces caledonius TaxID=3134107 RepID=A0ABU8U8A2_9ACTN
MIPRDRISVIRVASAHLAQMPWDEVSFVLGELKVSSEEIRSINALMDWTLHKENREPRLKRILSQQDDNIIGNIKSYLLGTEEESNVKAEGASDHASASGQKIFLVHGHARDLRNEVHLTVARLTGKEVVVLHDQANPGLTLLEKFLSHADSAAHAVIILTGDDLVERGDSAVRRGRQNVIFELGFFFGRLGRSHVSILIDQGVERPSDIEGLVYISIDGAGMWKNDLARELDSAGIKVDYSRIPR